MIKIKERMEDLKNIFSMISCINEESRLDFNKDGLNIKTATIDGISLITIHISKDIFEEYKVKEDLSCTLNMGVLNKMLKKLCKKEILLEVTENKIIVRNAKDWYSINYFASAEDERPIPNPEFKNIWNVETKELFDLFSNLLDFSQICAFISNGNLKVYTRGLHIEGESILSAKEVIKEECKGWFDLTFLLKLIDIKNLFKKVNLSFNDGVCKISNEEKGIKLDYYLAARIEEEING